MIWLAIKLFNSIVYGLYVRLMHLRGVMVLVIVLLVT